MTYNNRKYLLRLSLDHPELSLKEFESLIEIYGGKINAIENIGKLYLIDTNLNEDKMVLVASRSAIVHFISKVVIIDHISINRFIKKISLWLSKNVERGAIIRFKIYNLLSTEDTLSPKKLFEMLHYEGVNQCKKQYKFIVVISDRYRILSILIKEVKRRFLDRLPSKRPVFSPFSLHPKLARIMINLTGIKENQILLDPFCGVGGILIEASKMGIENIGIDIKKRWIYGAKQNIYWLNKDNLYTHLILGDGCAIPLRKVDHIATDPPYGRITTTVSRDVFVIYKRFIKSADKIISTDGKIVFMSPHTLNVEDILRNSKMREKNKYILPVHRSLTRLLHIMER